MLIDDHEFEELNPIIHENEEAGFIEAENGGSFMSFLLGGIFANMIMPKKEKTIKLQEIHKPNPSANLMSQEEKDFLSCIWSIEKEIKKAEKDGKWVRLYCLLQTVRHLNETEWDKFIEGNYGNQEILDQNLLVLLNYILEIKPETVYWPKVSDSVKQDLENGGLRVDLEDLSYTFNGKPLTEEPW